VAPAADENTSQKSRIRQKQPTQKEIKGKSCEVGNKIPQSSRRRFPGQETQATQGGKQSNCDGVSIEKCPPRARPRDQAPREKPPAKPRQAAYEKKGISHRKECHRAPPASSAEDVQRVVPRFRSVGGALGIWKRLWKHLDLVVQEGKEKLGKKLGKSLNVGDHGIAKGWSTNIAPS